MTLSLETWTWPLARAGEAVEALAKAARLPRAATAPDVSSVEAAASALGLEAERLRIPHADLDALLRDAVPALLSVHEEEHVVAVLRTSRTRARIVTPERTVRTIPLATLRDALHGDAERTHGARIDALFDRVSLDPAQRASARGALLRELSGSLPLDAGWSLRLSPSAPFGAQLASAGVSRALWTMTLAHAATFLSSLLAWWIIGRAALTGHLERGWLYAWALLLVMIVPARVFTTWWQGTASIGAGMLLKQRMLSGALHLEPEEIRQQGTGQLLGRVLEVDALEDLVMHGGFVSLVALVELAITIPVLAAGPAGALAVVLFLAWMALAAWLVGRFAARWIAWSRAR
ncbi:MAG TPA: hypothetical protein VNO21_18630, partial [Polyangiaceae bacterium]|nr:hypothetical protein [Polyangiaceae bacterium]